MKALKWMMSVIAENFVMLNSKERDMNIATLLFKT